MLHLWILKVTLSLGYYIATIGYPLFETYKTLGEKTFCNSWRKVVSYWIIFSIISLLDSLLWFVSGYMVYRILEALFLLWLMLPTYSGALLLHQLFLDKGFNFLDEAVLSKAPPALLVLCGMKEAEYAPVPQKEQKEADTQSQMILIPSFTVHIL